MERRSTAIRACWGLFLIALAAHGGEAQEAGATRTPRTPAEWLKQFRTSGERDLRAAAFEHLAAGDAAAVTALKGVVDAILAEGERSYAALLAPRIRAAHLERLGNLTEDQVRKVLAMRRLWKEYLLEGGDREKFQETYLKPVQETAAWFLCEVKDLEDEEVRTRRARLEEHAAYQARCHEILKLKPDPTEGRKSPTGIAYAPLTQPPAFADRLRHLERTLVLAHSVASSGARRVLLMNDEAAREIDVQEAEFGLFCNEVRLLAGTVAWRVEPLGCAVTRDHSNDRKEGRAEGHMSTFPGKRGFGDRNTRMGAPFYNSEGAGGGHSGRDYAHGLSYGGGHTGPLYSLKRNCVGVGRRDGVYTSQYRFDETLLHPCPATENELWMPPGVEAQDLPGAEWASAYRAMKAGMFGAAAAQAGRAKPRNGLERALATFFRLAAEVEADWAAEGLVQVERTGDLFQAKRRLAEGARSFKGIPAFEGRSAEIAARLESKEAKDEIRAGEIFYQMLAAPPKDEVVRVQLWRQFCKRHEESSYARAAEALLKDPKEEGRWSSVFVARNPAAKHYGYPPAAGAAR
jgi:hypothetical protein